MSCQSQNAWKLYGNPHILTSMYSMDNALGHNHCSTKMIFGNVFPIELIGHENQNITVLLQVCQ